MKLLLIVPHPDDEVYGAGGTILEWSRAGERVGLVTLTRGEKGRTLGLANSPEELADLRAAELSACLKLLGVADHRQLTYPDGGLAGVDAAELEAVARAAMLDWQPQTVLTFAPNGSNGHPDHVATSGAVRAAWNGLDARPDLWFYAGPPPEDPLLQGGYRAPNLSRDVAALLPDKLRAIACHRSQALSTVDFFRRFPERVVREQFHRVAGRRGDV